MKVQELAEILESVKVAPMQPDDVVVIRCNGCIDDDIRGRLEAHLKQYFGERKIFVHGNDVDIEIVRTEQAAG